MTNLTDLARHWLNKTARGKGIRLDAEQLDFLNAIGVGEIIAGEAAKLQREQCQKRTLRSNGAADTEPSGTASETEASGATPSRSSEKATPRGGASSEARARQMFG